MDGKALLVQTKSAVCMVMLGRSASAVCEPRWKRARGIEDAEKLQHFLSHKNQMKMLFFFHWAWIGI